MKYWADTPVHTSDAGKANSTWKKDQSIIIFVCVFACSLICTWFQSLEKITV